jgi:hypothetical protein
VRVVKTRQNEEFSVGCQGEILKYKWGKFRVLLDGDKYGSDFYEDELEVID